jgi:dUTP pyrophosphatase
MLIELLYPDAVPPKRATEGSAGYDLTAYLKGRTVQCGDGFLKWEAEAKEEDGVVALTLKEHEMALIPLGFKARLPEGCEGQIRPRSGTSFKKGLQIPNAPGTIDSDYPDEWMVIVRNPSPMRMRIEHGERIAQLVIARYEVVPVTFGKVGVTTSRTGGFGST